MNLVRFFKYCWLACVLAVLGLTLVRTEASGYNLIAYDLARVMGFLSFPFSILVGFFIHALYALQKASGISFLNLFESHAIGNATTWLLYAGVGYVQWFIVVPKLWNKLMARRAEARKKLSSRLSREPFSKTDNT